MKTPFLGHIEDFELVGLGRIYDYLLAFSVLNHCTTEQRDKCFRSMGAIMHEKTKAYVTHAIWMTSVLPEFHSLRLSKVFEGPRELGEELNMQDWGWPQSESIFPILEIHRE